MFKTIKNLIYQVEYEVAQEFLDSMKDELNDATTKEQKVAVIKKSATDYDLEKEYATDNDDLPKWLNNRITKIVSSLNNYKTDLLTTLGYAYAGIYDELENGLNKHDGQKGHLVMRGATFGHVYADAFATPENALKTLSSYNNEHFRKKIASNAQSLRDVCNPKRDCLSQFIDDDNAETSAEIYSKITPHVKDLLKQAKQINSLMQSMHTSFEESKDAALTCEALRKYRSHSGFLCFPGDRNQNVEDLRVECAKTTNPTELKTLLEQAHTKFANSANKQDVKVDQIVQQEIRRLSP